MRKLNEYNLNPCRCCNTNEHLELSYILTKEILWNITCSSCMSRSPFVTQDGKESIEDVVKHLRDIWNHFQPKED